MQLPQGPRSPRNRPQSPLSPSSTINSNSNEALLSAFRPSEYNNLIRLFRQYDADGSGAIDAVELESLLVSNGFQLSKEHLTELLEQVDVDNSGELEFLEFVQFVQMWKSAAKNKLFESSVEKERIQSVLRSPCILPDAPWMTAWNVCMVLLSAFYFGWVLYLDTLSDKDYTAFTTDLVPVDVVATVLFAVDIVLAFRTGYRETELRDDYRLIARRYVHTVFVPDLLALLPMNLFTSHTMASRVLHHFRLLKYCRLPFRFEWSGRSAMTRRYIYLHLYVIPLLTNVVLFASLLHFCAVVWTGVSHIDNIEYTEALHFVTHSVVTAGFGPAGDQEFNRVSERWVSIVMCLLGTIVGALMVGNVIVVTLQIDTKAKSDNRLMAVRSVCEASFIPRSLRYEVVSFQGHQLNNISNSAFVGSLPAELQKNLLTSARMRVIEAVGIFDSAHQALKAALAQELCPQAANPEEKIFMMGSWADEMYCLNFGYIDVILRDATDGTTHVVKTLKNGDHFGEVSVLRKCRRAATTRAVTYCNMLVLTRQALNDTVFRFPKFKAYLEGMEVESSLVDTLVTEKGNDWTSNRRGTAFLVDDDTLLAPSPSGPVMAELQASSGGLSASTEAPVPMESCASVKIEAGVEEEEKFLARSNRKHSMMYNITVSDMHEVIDNSNQTVAESIDDLAQHVAELEQAVAALMRSQRGPSRGSPQGPMM